MRADTRALSPLSPAAFHILLALAAGDRHGYAIMKEAADQSEGRVRIGPGTLYRSIQNLLAVGWIEEAGDRPDPASGDERRRYYRLTHKGREVVTNEARRLADLVRVARRRRLLGHQRPAEG
jgi:DNA-binding PadR family transcriptional regulator